MLKKNVCAVSGRETDVCSHGLWACLWCLGLAEALLSGKQVDVACLVSSKGVIWLQGKPWCALGVLLSLSSVTSALELPWLTRWSRAGFAFWGHVLTGCWVFFLHAQWDLLLWEELGKASPRADGQYRTSCTTGVPWIPS